MSKFCANCGSKIDEEADICLKCGHMVKKQKTSGNLKTNIYGIIGFVVSIMALLTSFVFIGGLFGIVSLVLSILGLNYAKKLKEGKGLSIAGLIISIISIVIVVVYFGIIVFIVLMEDLNNTIDNHTCSRHGSSYEVVNGYNVKGSYEYDEWYCCPTGRQKNTRNCIEL